MGHISFLHNPVFREKVQIDALGETPFGKEIRICMPKGSVMREHSAPGAITIMVVEGNVTITSPESEETLQSGDMVYFESKIPHSLIAHENSVIRLTLSKNDSAQRVSFVLK